MLVALPMKDDVTISSHFAKATHYAIVDEDSHAVYTQKAFIESGCFAKKHIISWLKENDVTAVYIKDIGPHYWEKLTESHIDVLRLPRHIRSMAEFWDEYQLSTQVAETAQLKPSKKRATYQQDDEHLISQTQSLVPSKINRIYTADERHKKPCCHGCKHE